MGSASRRAARRGRRPWFGALVGFLSASCVDPAVHVTLVFPSEESFLRSNTVSVDVFDGEGTGAQSAEAICRALATDASVAPAGVRPLASAPAAEACFAYNGGVRFERVPAGRRVVFAEAVAADGTPLLRGCAITELDASTADSDTSPPIEVPLVALPGTLEDGVLHCESVAAKCEERKPCVD